MVLHRQVLLSLAIAVIAEAILMRTSAEQVPFLHRVAPRYLKLVTYSNLWPFMLISALMSVVLLVLIFFFSVHMLLFCLRVCIAATHKLDVGKSYVAHGPSTKGDSCVVVMECFLHCLL